MGALALAVSAAVALTNGLIPGFSATADEPIDRAEAWVQANVPNDRRILAEEAVAERLIDDGHPPAGVVSVDASDPADAAIPADAWQDWDYIVATDALLSLSEANAAVDAALTHSRVLAAFGTENGRVEVRRTERDGIADATVRAERATDARGRAGEQLAMNRRLDVSGAAEADLSAGRVDDRILLALGQKLATDSLTVADFPVIAGEEQGIRRQVLVTVVNGRYLTDDRELRNDTVAWFTDLPGPVAPENVAPAGEGVLITYAAEAPSDLLPTPDPSPTR
ncbi:hypothetical protein [Planctomonas psychrotolerans]|uniref:hypothetical protein n=1 Tax=Planctomonas psychrotolerans TaxID=2528712 RepID=UPI001D0D1F28|nr:hypothetical protein [Planctomonas psychrotolerans]